jgi:hypothetical protein
MGRNRLERMYLFIAVFESIAARRVTVKYKCILDGHHCITVDDDWRCLLLKNETN